MNYLAHIYLSGNNRRIQVGNFIGDAVKGNAYLKYPAEITEGILLHRMIDDFTDHHPLMREAVELMRGEFGRYSAVLADIFFDHLLAANFKTWSDKGLKRFARGFYGGLLLNYYHLPLRIRQFVWHFIMTDRLYRYASAEGIRESLEIMTIYKNLPVDPENAIAFLEKNKKELQEMFTRFFPELIRFSEEKRLDFEQSRKEKDVLNKKKK